MASSEGSGLRVAAYRKELLLGVCADGQGWPQTLSSLHSPALTNKPLIVRHAGSPRMSKGPFYPGWLAHTKDTHTRAAADRDGPSPADATATALLPLPITETCVSSQSLAQRSIQTLPVTGAHLACRWTEMWEKASQCFSKLAWESLGMPGFFTSFSRKAANGFFQSVRLGYWESVSETINTQKSGNPGRPFPHPPRHPTHR